MTYIRICQQSTQGVKITLHSKLRLLDTYAAKTHENIPLECFAQKLCCTVQTNFRLGYLYTNYTELLRETCQGVCFSCIL